MCFFKNLSLMLLLIVALFVQNATAELGEIPTSQQMQDLKPQVSYLVRLYDSLFTSTAKSANEAHDRYTDPEALADIEDRLNRVRETGDPQDILSPDERTQFKANIQELRILENRFFDHWYLRAPMNAAIHFQKWLTRKNSPLPIAQGYHSTLRRLKEAAQKNILYSHWFKQLPPELLTEAGPQTWGELLLRFNSDAKFRAYWIKNQPSTLFFLKNLYEVWAWEDTSVRAVTVRNTDTLSEYWVLHFREREKVPNRFWLTIHGDFEELLRLEYAPTIFFNRITKIVKNNRAINYIVEAIEKGRTMELTATPNEFGVHKHTFAGSELLRRTKVDEFLQRRYVQKGSLNLFLGLRTLQMNQIQELMRMHPDLVFAVAQFGFSVTGGRAQTVSNRTDSADQQLLKLTATLIDFIEFAKTKNVKHWFRQNVGHVLRTLFVGIGAGDSRALKEPSSKIENNPTLSLPSALSCRSIF